MKTYKYIALAVLTLGLAACTQEDDIATQGNQKDAPIAIASAGVAELTTRATIDDNNRLVGGSMGVYVTSSTTNGNYNYKGSNVKWTYSQGGWELDDTTLVFFENNSENQQIAAYYPYAEPDEGKVQISLPEAYGDDYEKYDCLYGEYAPLSGNPATIQMSHLLAKVTVKLTTGTDIDSDDYVKSVELVGVPRTADWKVPCADLKNLGDATNILLYGDGSTCCGYAIPNGAEFLSLRIMTNNSRIFTLTVSLDNKDTQEVVETLTAGTHYIISVKVGRDRITVEQVSMEDFGSPFGDGWNNEEDLK